MDAVWNNRQKRRGGRRKDSVSKRRYIYDSTLVLLLCLLTIGGMVLFGGVRVWSIGILSFGLFCVGVLYCVRPFIQEELRPLKLPPGILFLFLFAVYLFLRIPGSAVQDDALFQAISMLGVVVAYYVWSGVGARSGRWKFAVAFLLFAVALICWYALILHVHESNRVLMLSRPEQYGMRASATYMCPNHFAHLLEIVICLSLGLVLLRSNAVWLRIMAVYSFAMACPALFLTQSRSGWIGAVIGGCVTGLLVLLRRSRKWFFVMLFVLPVCIVIVGAGFWFASPMIRERIQGANPESPDGAVAIRLVMWKDSLQMIKDAPLLGHGGGSFRWIYPSYKSHAQQLWARYPHNEYLQVLVEYGIVGMVLLLVALLAFLWKMLRLIMAAERERDAVLAAVAVGALGASLAHAVFDFNMHIYANILMLAAVCGMAASCSFASGEWRVRKLKTPWWIIVYGAFIALCIVGLTGASMSALSYGYTFRGMQNDLAFKQQDAVSDYRTAAKLDRFNWRPLLGQATVLRGQSAWEIDRDVKQQKIQDAIKLYDQVLQLNPYEFEAQYGKSTLYNMQGDSEKALQCLQEVLDIAPNDVFFLNRAGIILRQQGEKQQALELFERAERLGPTHETIVNLRILRKQ